MFVDDTVLAVLDLRIFKPRILRVDALGVRVYKSLPNVGSMQQGFGRDAAHQQTGSAQLALFLDERSFQPVLSGANRSGVAAGTTSNHNEIVGHYIFILADTASVSAVISSRAAVRVAP